MITTIIALRYNPDRKYFGGSTKYRNIDLCLQSLLFHTDIIKEIILVNHTPKCVVDDDPQIEYIRTVYGSQIKIINLNSEFEAFNKSWMLNVGIRHAHEEFFMMHDIDCIIDPALKDIFFKQLEVLRNQHAIHFELKGNYGQDWQKDIDWNKFQYPQSFTPIINQLTCYNSPSHIVCSLNKVLEIRGYNELFQDWGYEDYDFLLRLKRDGKIVVDNMGYHIHQVHNFSHNLQNHYNQCLIGLDHEIVNQQNWGDLNGPTRKQFNDLQMSSL